MNKKRFYEYCESFNSGEKEKTFDEFYTQNARFEHPIKGVFKGKSEIVVFWSAGHKGIHEALKPKNVLMDNDKVAAEFLIEWHCTEDTDYLGPRKKGEVYYAECAAFYHLRNDKFDHVKLYLKELGYGDNRMAD